MNSLFLKILFLSEKKIKRYYLKLMDKVYTQQYSTRFRSCGKNIHIYYPCIITGPQFMEVGENVHINRRAIIRAEGTLKIGDNVHIAQNMALYTINHDYLGEALPYDRAMIEGPVIVERNVWIGINVTIVPGVTIGEGAIIGAGTVVSRDVPPLSIVGSQPLRILKYRDKDHYCRLEKEKKYGGPSGRPYSSISQNAKDK